MAKSESQLSGLKPYYTFDQLVVGSHNQMAAAASLQVSKKLGEAYNPLFIYGPTGVGKTHMMQAIAHAALSQNPQLKVKYILAERFVNEVISAISDDNIVGLRQQYSQTDLLLVDDVQFILESKSTQGEFLHVFNNLHEHNLQVIITCDRAPKQLTNLDKAIRSRLEWGLSADIKVPDLITRIEILRLKQKNYGMNLSDEAIRFVCEQLYSNVRELEGFLKRLHAYVTLSHQDISMELIKNVVSEILPEDVGVPPEGVNILRGAKPILASLMNLDIRQPMGNVGEVETVQPKTNGHVESAKKTEAELEVAFNQLPDLPSAPPPITIQPEAIKEQPPLNPEPAVARKGQKIIEPKKAEEKIIEDPVPEVEPAPMVKPLVAEEPPPAPKRVFEPLSTEPAPLVPAKEVKRSPLVPQMMDEPVAQKETSASIASSQPKSSSSTEEHNLPSDNTLEAGTSTLGLENVEDDSEPLPSGHKEVFAVFFYPISYEQQLDTVVRKFQEVVRKHKLKFRLRRVTSHAYNHKGKINYSSFVDVCKQNKVPVAIVIGPPPTGSVVTEQEFYDLLAVTLDVQGVSLQMVSWNEIDKDYRYLNLALDIALVRTGKL